MTTLSSFDTQIHCDEQIPCCPYCDKSLDIGGQMHDGMHDECSQRFSDELDKAFPDEYPILSIPVHLEPIEFDWSVELSAISCVRPDRNED